MTLGNVLDFLSSWEGLYKGEETWEDEAAYLNHAGRFLKNSARGTSVLTSTPAVGLLSYLASSAWPHTHLPYE